MLYHSIILNGSVAAVGSFVPPADCRIVYEVIRVTDGVFLFLDDHIERLRHSAQLAGLKLTLSAADIRAQLEQLLHHNGVQTGNIRLEYCFAAGKPSCQAVYFISHRYPSEEDYRSGVGASLLVASRTNPNAKIMQPLLREQANRIIAEKNLYDVILVHPDGYITEGSRSTIFMVRHGAVYTAPVADVLPGITRKYVLQACRDLSVRLVETRVSVGRLSAMDAVFIAGTSPGVLPVASVDAYRFALNDVTVRRIMKRYGELTGF